MLREAGEYIGSGLGGLPKDQTDLPPSPNEGGVTPG